MEFVEIPVYIARGIKNNDINMYDNQTLKAHWSDTSDSSGSSN